MKKDFLRTGLLWIFFSFTTHAFCSETLRETTVRADKATFDRETIFLSGDVYVINDEYEIHSQRATLYRDEKKQSKIEYPWIEIAEKVFAKFYEKYFLECEKVNIDYIDRQLLFSGKKPIHFYDDQRKVIADTAYVEFFEQNSDFQIEKIILLGNIEMYASSLKGDDRGEQYAIADRVEYYPAREVVYLKADAGKRVLFFDRIKEITISAESVKATRKGEKEMIEGIGDVRFIFKEDEIKHLKDKFALKDL